MAAGGQAAGLGAGSLCLFISPAQGCWLASCSVKLLPQRGGSPVGILQTLSCPCAAPLGCTPGRCPAVQGPVCRSQRGFHPLCHSPAPLLQPVTGAVLATRFGCTRGPLSQPDAAPGLQPDTSSHQVGGSRGSAGAWLDLRLYQTYHWCSVRRMDPAVTGPPAVLHWIQPDYGLSGGLESIWFDAKAGF